MRQHRFIGKFDFSKGTITLSSQEIVNQIRNVLRLKENYELILCDGKLNEAIARVVSINNDSVELKIMVMKTNTNEPDKNIILCCSILKKENFEWVIQKAVEIGVSRITPIITERTVKLNINETRLNKIIKEAAEQSNRGVLPILNPTTNFTDLFKQTGPSRVNIIFDRTGAPFQEWATKQQNPLAQTNNYIILIGPEGGWTEKEIQLTKNNKFHIFSLGKLNLRAETAAIIASYLVIHS